MRYFFSDGKTYIPISGFSISGESFAWDLAKDQGKVPKSLGNFTIANDAFEFFICIAANVDVVSFQMSGIAMRFDPPASAVEKFRIMMTDLES